jgi:hypothetical protein
MHERHPILGRAWARTALATVALVTSGWASAADIELYDRPDFGGTRLTLDSAAADLGPYGLGGRVSSVVVVRGQWEFCTQPQWRGACVTVGPGRYGRLPPALNDNLASLRPAAVRPVEPTRPPEPRPQRPRPPEPMPKAGIVLYGGTFGGSELRVLEAVPNLARKGFNDTANSIDVFGGVWELCSDGGFSGQCLQFPPGRHVLPPALRDRLSSVRPVTGPIVQERPDRPGRPDDHHGLPWQGVRPAIVFFEHRDGSGRELPLMTATPSLGEAGFNDRASSVEVFRGRWQLCRHANYEGECIVLGPGRHNLDGRMNDEVSSARPLFGRDERPIDRQGAVTLYDQLDLRGRSFFADEEVRNLRDERFNDRAVAIEVHGGRWELCSAANFRERCLTFGPGWHRLPDGLAGEVSSLRPR